MIGKRSRYYKLDQASFPDRQGVERQCKALRRTSQIGAQFVHTLEAGDRLDHLAYKYYGQSLHWWRICDANMAFASPLALIDKLPHLTIRFVLTTQHYPLPIAQLMSALQLVNGVIGVEKENFVEPLATTLADGAPMFSLPSALAAALDQAVTTQQLPVSLQLAMQAQSISLNGSLRVRAPSTGLWQIDINEGEAIYRFWYVDTLTGISVNQAILTTQLSLLVSFNRLSTNEQAIADAMTAAGFVIGETQTQVRAGEGVFIPPKYTGKN